MQEASWAILLPQWPCEDEDPYARVPVPEVFTGAVPPGPPAEEDHFRVFRPNLMYGIRHLQGRLKERRRLHVFLIGGITQDQLPEDLKGIHIERIRPGARASMADDIAERFARNLLPSDVQPA